MSRPNILLIMTDQQRADTMHYLNPASPCITPNLDRLAEESLCFDNAYTCAPVCTPARASLQTGLYPSVTGMCTNIYQQGCMTHELADRPFLLSRRLNAAGYRCGFTGKWHLGMGKDKTSHPEGRLVLRQMEQGSMAGDAYKDYGTLPSDVGYIGDDFPGHGDGGHGTALYQAYLRENGLEEVIEDRYGGSRPGDHSHGGVVTSGLESTVEYYLAQRTKSILDELTAEGDPFFMAVNFWGPHEPYFALKEDYDLYRDLEIPPWPSYDGSAAVEHKFHRLVQRPEMGWDFFANNLRHYYALLTGIDRSIGQILDHLKEKGLYDNTIVIFCADHGDSQGCHNGLENKSCHMYQEVTRIPLMVRFPGGEHRILHQFASTVDLYSTVLDAAGYDSSYFQSGHSLMPLEQDPTYVPREYAVCESVGAFPLTAMQRMYRWDKWKYVFNSGGEDELYDLEADPLELRNLAHREPEILRQLQIGLGKAMYRHGDDIAPWFCKMNLILDWSLEK